MFEDNKRNPLYRPVEELLDEKEYVQWLIENDPRCPLFTIDNEKELVSSGKFEKEIVDLYKILEFEDEKGFLMNKRDSLRLRLLKNIAMKRSTTRKIVEEQEKTLIETKQKNKAKKPQNFVDPLTAFHSKFVNLKN